MDGSHRSFRLLFALAVPALAWGTNYVSLQSGGQSFVVDINSDKVR
jgi:hypothetical protein